MQKRNFLAWRNLHAHLVWIYKGAPQVAQGEAKRKFFTAWFLLRGSLRVRVEGVEAEAVAGDWVLLPIGTDWRRFSPGARIVSLNFAASWATGHPLFAFAKPLVFKPQETRGWLTAVKPMLAMVQRRFPGIHTELPLQEVEFGAYALLQYYLQVWLRRVWLRLEKRGVEAHLLTLKDDRAIAMKDRLDALPLHEPFRLEILARLLGLSASQTNRIFYAEFSTTPKRYFERRRLEAALSILRNSAKPIKEIAWHLGFKHQSEFSAWCKKHAGSGPRVIRSNAVCN